MENQWKGHVLLLAHSGRQEESHLGMESMAYLHAEGARLRNGQLGQPYNSQ